MAVLPDAFGDDERCIGIEITENFHTQLLGIDEAMLLFFIERMGADNRPAFGFEGFGQHGFHFRLFGPAFLIGGKAKVAIGQKISVFGFQTVHNQTEAEASARLV